MPRPLPTAPAPVRVAVLDLYNGIENQGMRCIREMIEACSGAFHGVPFTFDVYETRLKDETPGLDYDVYVSTGGPGSPFDGEGKAWERHYFAWLDAVWNHNERRAHGRKHVLFICHSFQMMVRFFQVAAVTERHSESFGIFPVHPVGCRDALFAGLDDPFYAADFRHYQAVEPDGRRLRDLGADVIALEKKRPYVPYERAVMALRLSPELVGVQFHPEADPEGMGLHFRKPERHELVVKRHGQAKYERLLHRLDDPTYLKRTHDAVMPAFLAGAVRSLRPECALPDVA